MADTNEAAPGNSWCWSTDEERFEGQSATRELAIADALESLIGADAEPGPHTIWIGVASDALPHLRVGSDPVLDRLRDDAYELAGETSEDWLRDLTPEIEADLTQRLTTAFRDWVAAHGLTPTWWPVLRSEAVVVDVPAVES